MAVLFLLVLTFLRTLNRGDAQACVLMESCILPCSFNPGNELVLHWIQETTGTTAVHSYYFNEDQLALQDQRFRGRTSLFKDQISRGNASLWLKQVQLQDRGRYKCYTSTISGNKESFVNLEVEGPVRRVDIQRVENRITCSSEGIYPKPGLTWSSSPPSTLTPPDEPRVQQTDQQLYSISSSLTPSDSAPDLVYSCTVSTGRSRRRSTLFKTTSLNGSKTETTIPCTAQDASDLTWRFNHSQIILTRTRAAVSYTVAEQWRQQVKNVTSGSLILKDLSPAQEGRYTCEVSTAEETNITNTDLKINQDSSTKDAGVAAAVVGVIACAVLVGVAALYMWKKKKCTKQQSSTNNGII